MKIGILGGTFNPVHRGHMEMAKAALSEYDLDFVYLIPTNIPPHKQFDDTGVTAEQRCDMLRLAVFHDECFKVCDIEILNGGKSYTVDTLQTLKKTHPEDKLFFIMGMDMLRSFDTWYMPEEIAKLAELIVFTRGCTLEQAKSIANEKHDKTGAIIHLCKKRIPPISSTNVREAVKNAESISKLVVYPVEKYIYECCLYQPDDIRALYSSLSKRLSVKRYYHCISTMREAIELAKKYKANGKQARCAGLLHDCMKLRNIDYVGEAQKWGLPVNEYELITPGLLHPKLGAYFAEHELHITDKTVLDAIASHTLCRENMTDIDKIVYIADKIEQDRSFAGVMKLRHAAEKSLDDGVIACMDFTIDGIKSSGKSLDPALAVARDSILKSKGKSRLSKHYNIQKGKVTKNDKQH